MVTWCILHIYNLRIKIRESLQCIYMPRAEGSGTYTTLQMVYEKYTPLCEITRFLCCFWMKHRLGLPDYGASVRKCPKGFCS